MNEPDFAAMRTTMIASQLRTVGVNDPRVLAAIEAVARERFVPESRASLAYADTSLALGDGRFLNTPVAAARLINEAKILPNDHILLIGAATGYLAAVLARLAAHVVAVDDDAALLDTATRELGAIGNVSIVHGALTEGAPAHAPYQVILIDGAVEQLPSALVDQLAVGGRLITGLVERGVTRLAIGRKTAGGFGVVAFADAACLVFPEFNKPKAFSFS